MEGEVTDGRVKVYIRTNDAWRLIGYLSGEDAIRAREMAEMGAGAQWAILKAMLPNMEPVTEEGTDGND